MYFFFNDTATTEIYTLSLHDALPILLAGAAVTFLGRGLGEPAATPSALAYGAVLGLVAGLVALAASYVVVEATADEGGGPERDRKSTRLNSSHANISYAVFCLKKKNK